MQTVGAHSAKLHGLSVLTAKLGSLHVKGAVAFKRSFSVAKDFPFAAATGSKQSHKKHKCYCLKKYLLHTANYSIQNAN